MDRRLFLRLSGAAALSALWSCREQPGAGPPFDITFDSDAGSGHHLTSAGSFAEGETVSAEYAIIGAGIAGLSAAYGLRDKECVLCEVSSAIGGSSGAGRYGASVFSRGAHYDLAYPEHWGTEVLRVFEECGIIAFNDIRRQWEFVEKQYVIPAERESQCYDGKTYRDDVLREGPAKNEFLALVTRYSGKMPLPTRLIDNATRTLNAVDFQSFLSRYVALPQSFIRGLDYQMADDYGAGSATVSALAGVHYYACRPYYERDVELFSPPQGNFYFAEKLRARQPDLRILNECLVTRLEPSADGVVIRAIRFSDQRRITIRAQKAIYAGQKFALRYVFPADYPLFKNNRYAPWLAMNIIVRDMPATRAFWQNETLVADRRFLGFVDSRAQSGADSDIQVFTVYYCFSERDRKQLLMTPDQTQRFAAAAVDQVGAYFGRPIKHNVVKIFMKAMGHAMPIPMPGYLFSDANYRRNSAHIVYAGVDNARLPLLFEAVDSGLVAADLVRR